MSCNMDRLYVRFKGRRNYLSSTDLYEGLVEKLSARFPSDTISSIDLVMKKIITHHLNCIWPPMAAVTSDLVASLSYLRNDTQEFLQMSETNEKILERYDFDEKCITDCCRFTSGNTITYSGGTAFRDVYVFVSMAKYLNQLLYKDESVQWLVSRLRFKRLFRQSNDPLFSVQMIGNIDPRTTLIRMFENGNPAGEIFFYRREGK